MAAPPETITVPAPPADTESDAYLYWLRDLLAPARVERFGGVLLVSGAPTPEHQDAWGRLYAWLLDWADGGPWGAVPGDPGGGARGEVLPAVELRLEGAGLPRPVRGRAPDNGVPDLVLRRRENRLARRVPSGPGRRAPAGYVEGAPDLVVEVLSPGTERQDLTTKRQAFAAAGVAGYWVLDWRDRTALVLTRPEGGDYRDETRVGWGELVWPPAGEPGSARWGDHPNFPRG